MNFVFEKFVLPREIREKLFDSVKNYLCMRYIMILSKWDDITITSINEN